MIDICSVQSGPLLSLHEALAKILAAITPVYATERVSLLEALGRVTAETVCSPIAMPFDRNAAMDGYAFASADAIKGEAFTLEVVGTAWAGLPFTGQLQTGQCIRIFTGAVVPLLADSVVMQEHVQVEGTLVHFSAGTTCLQNIRAAGEDVQQGGCLVNNGKKLTAYDIALLASAGIAAINVKRRLHITIFSTGDELASLGQALVTGKIYDSNRYLLLGLLTDPAYHVHDVGIIGDDLSLLQHTLLAAAEVSDAIITTGGVSVGNADLVKAALSHCGQVAFWKIAIKPGKPMAFGTIGKTFVFGLPGNPVAVATTFQALVAPALEQLAGMRPKQRLRLNAITSSALHKSKGRMEFQRGILSQDDTGVLKVSSAGGQGSHLLAPLSKSNCFIILPAECGGVNIGDCVVVEPFATSL